MRVCGFHGHFFLMISLLFYSKEEQRGAKQGKKQPNLLTWAAKMQIRFLHAEDPYQWTPEVLADSFPTTKENIIAILKSTWLPVDEKQIERHDRRVHQNWLTLQKELKKNQREAVERTGGKIQGEGEVDERIVKILNAAGIPSLPGPSQDEILLTRKKLTEKLHPKVSGAFSQILLDYKVQFKVADKDKLKISEEPHKTAFVIGDKEAVPLLTSISSMSLNDTEMGLNDGNDATERMAGFRTERNPEIEHDQSLSESAKSQQVISSLRQSRRQRRLRETTVTKDNLEELQMQGTGKVS